MRTTLRLLGILSAACGCAFVNAESVANDEHARARLVSEHTSLVAGETARLGIAFDIDPGWHLYWDGLNDSGFAPQMSLKLPEGFKARPLLWPAPKRYFPSDGILDHVYFNHVLLILPIDVSGEVPPGHTVRIEADLEWLVCKEECIPGGAKVSIELPVKPRGDNVEPSAEAAMFKAATERVPKALPKPLPQWLTVRMDERSLEVLATGATFIAFYPYEKCQRPIDLIREGEVRGERLHVKFDKPDANRRRIIGVIEIRRQGEPKADAYVVDSVGGDLSEAESIKLEVDKVSAGGP